MNKATAQKFANDSPTAPGRGGIIAAYSDTVDIFTGSAAGEVAAGLLVMSSGNLVCTGIDGVDVTIPLPAAGGYPVRIDMFVSRIKATNTTVAAGAVLAYR